MRNSTALVLALLLLLSGAAMAAEQQFANLGDCALRNGQTIHECRIGYRTYGNLNPAKSNVILLDTWFTGTTKALEEFVLSGGLLDSSKYFIVAVDAIGNGVSISASNSRVQPRQKFPQFGIADMVSSQHRLLTEKLGIKHVKAVVGISMGGMQVFEWMVAYPEFMDIAIPVMGSPRMTSYDLICIETELTIIREDPAFNGGEYSVNPAVPAIAGIDVMGLTTPQDISRKIRREDVKKTLQQWTDLNRAIDLNDRYRQLEAMATHDVSARFGGSMEAAAKAVRAKVFVVVSKQDHSCVPLPAIEFAKLMNASLLELDSDCGHAAGACEADKMNAAVSGFIARTEQSSLVAPDRGH